MGREWAERGMGREMRGERGTKMKRGAAGEEGGEREEGKREKGAG